MKTEKNDPITQEIIDNLIACKKRMKQIEMGERKPEIVLIFGDTTMRGGQERLERYSF